MKIKKMNERLKMLNKQSLLAFSLSCLERLYPNFDAFCNLANLPYSLIYSQMLDSFWDYLFQPDVKKIEVEKFRQVCLEICPDSEDYSTWLTSLAIDAVCGIDNTLEFLETGEIESIERVSRNLFDTLYIYLYIVNTPNLGVEIDDGGYDSEEYPLIQAECNKQLEDIEFLKTVESFSRGDVISFRERAKGGLLLFERGLFLKQDDLF